MLWTHPLLLAGLAALIVPILVHLLMKVPTRKIRFSTLRFLPVAPPPRQRRKIQHWLLLLLRLILVTLLIAAFARPYWPAQSVAAAPPKPPRAIVIVLDRSASMQTAEGKTTRWDAALKSIDKLVSDLSEGDQVTLVGAADQAQVITPWGPPAVARQTLSTLKATNEAGQLANGLRLGADLLSKAPAPKPELILVSDLQKSSWSSIDSIFLPADTHCAIESSSGPETANVAVMGLVTKGATKSSLKIALQNFSSQRQTALSVNCSLDHQPYFHGQSDVDANGRTELAMPPLTATPGWHQLQVDLATDDALPGDNRFFAEIFIPAPITIVVAEPHMELKNYERSSYFLTSALNPEMASDGPADALPAIGSLSVTVVEPMNLPTSLASSPRPSTIILPPLPELPAGLGSSIKRYLESGGGVLGWVGSGMDSVGYNGELGDIWPAHLIETETCDNLALIGGWKLGWWNRESPLFALFGTGGHGDLTLPKFRQRMRLDLSPDAEVLATFEDKTPFLISRKVGAGRVILVNSSPDTHWSDWPIHKTFLPLVQRLAYYLAQRSAQESLSLGPSLTSTPHGQLDLGLELANLQLQLVSSQGPPVSFKTDEMGVAHGINLTESGCYEIRNAQNEVLKAFCVNFPTIESDLSAYRAEEITNQLHFSPSSATHLAAPAVATFSVRREIWPQLLALLLALLFIELIWANRVRA